MKLASYVGTQSGYKGLGNILIRLRIAGIKEAIHLKPYGGTALRASHSEVVFEPTDGVGHLMPDGTCKPDSEGRLWCASSTGMDILPSWSKRRAGKLGGVRFKRINVSNTDKWELQTIHNTDAELVAKFFKDNEGALYDWQAIVSFIAKFIPDKDGRFMCSEVIAASLYIPDSAKVNPCDLQETVNNINCKNTKSNITESILNTKQFFLRSTGND